MAPRKRDPSSARGRVSTRMVGRMVAKECDALADEEFNGQPRGLAGLLQRGATRHDPIGCQRGHALSIAPPTRSRTAVAVTAGRQEHEQIAERVRAPIAKQVGLAMGKVSEEGVLLQHSRRPSAKEFTARWTSA